MVPADPLARALERHHQQIDDAIARHVAAAAPRDPQPLLDAVAALRAHIYVEEVFLFPALQGCATELMAPVFVMLREHGQLWRTLEDLVIELRLGDADGAPALALCRKLAAALLHHNGKEEQVIYSQIGALLSPEVCDRVQGALTSSELPDRWAPHRARTA